MMSCDATDEEYAFTGEDLNSADVKEYFKALGFADVLIR